MKLGEPTDLKLTKRYFEFNRQYAMRDAFDALVELITNSDDSYGRLKKKKRRAEDGGPILIEVCERRGQASILVVRDRAQGMTLQTMKDKLAEVGTRRSDSGDRGFMSRGAKDCTELGDMTFESIVDDRYYKAKVTTKAQFIPMVDKARVDEKLRKSLHIPQGNGTTVTIEITRHRLPRTDRIISDLPWHFALRDILDEGTSGQVLIKDLNSNEKAAKIVFRRPEGELVYDDNYSIPNYRDAAASIKIWRSPEPLEDISRDRFRRAGLIIKGKRAIHECSLLQPSFERDAYAMHYFGRIDCPYLDTLLDEYDDRREKGLEPTLWNPSLVIDPNRQNALNRDHPFTQKVLEFPTKVLKELIDKDRASDAKRKTRIANDDTRSKLDRLAKAASKFLQEQTEEMDQISGDDEVDESIFAKRGVLIIPTFANVAVNEVRSFGFYVSRKIYEGDVSQVRIKSDSSALEVLDPSILISPHRKRMEMLYGRFRVRGSEVKEGVYVETECDGLPKAEALLNVIERRIEEHYFKASLEFEHKTCTIRDGRKKTLRLFAKYPELVNEETEVEVVSENAMDLPVRGRCLLVPVEGSNYACADVKIEARRLHHKPISVIARLNGTEALTKVRIVQKEQRGVPMAIELRDEYFGDFRATWGDHEDKPNLLMVSTRHLSVRRYLGQPPHFTGQNSLHFKAILAEIVAESVCRKSLEQEAHKYGWLFHWADQKEDSLIAVSVLAELQKRVNKFLPDAHRIMIKDNEVSV